MQKIPKMKTYPSFEAWYADQSIENRTLISKLKKIVESTASHLTPSVKWGQGCWLNGNRPVCYIHTEPDHLQLGFYNGWSLADPKSLLKGKGKYVRYLVLKNTDILDVPAITKLLQQVVI